MDDTPRAAASSPSGDRDLNGSIEVLREGKPIPSALPALAQLYSQARDAGLALSVAKYARSEEMRRQMAKRRHDVKAALRTFGFTVKALDSGYRFDDDKAAAKIDAIRKALTQLEHEFVLLNDILNED